MNECLVTALKASFGDDTLLRVSEFKVEFNNGGRFVCGNTKAMSFRIVGDGTFSDGSKEKTGTWLDNNLVGKGTLFITNKYTANNVQVRGAGMLLDATQFKYTDGLKELDATSNDSYGKFSEIPQGNFERLDFTNSKIEVNIDDVVKNKNLLLFNCSGNNKCSGNFDLLGKCTSIRTLGVGNAPVFGTIEGFVSTARAAGRNVCSDAINLGYSGVGGRVTFNGSSLPVGGTIPLTWTETTITMNGVTIDA